MSWTRRKPVRILGIVLAILLLSVVAVQIFLPTEKIRDLALEQAREKLGREVSVGEVAVSLRGGIGVRLSDFVIHNPDGFGGENLMSTKALDLKLELGPLLKGEVRVHRLVVDTPVVNLMRRADGSDNFTFETVAEPATSAPPTAGEPAAAPPPISIASLTLKDGRMAFSDASAEA
ncbi:MAG: AsmA family protein, partial [Candidatus Krumholzibacteria bacterium]|nr:AsmA family protein [Candidatus Krumholzibacteria bacterium]